MAGSPGPRPGPGRPPRSPVGRPPVVDHPLFAAALVPGPVAAGALGGELGQQRVDLTRGAVAEQLVADVGAGPAARLGGIKIVPQLFQITRLNTGGGGGGFTEWPVVPGPVRDPVASPVTGSAAGP